MHAMSSNGEIVNKWRRCKYINEILKGNEKERTVMAICVDKRCPRRELERKGREMNKVEKGRDWNA